MGLEDFSVARDRGEGALTKAMRNTDKHRAAVIIASFTPFGYSGSSESFSSAAASCNAVSLTVFSPVPSVAAMCAAAGVLFSCSGSTTGFSMSDAEEVEVEGAIVGAVETSALAAFFFWRNVGSFMV